MNIEWLVAENVQETIWLRLKRLTSISLCRKIIQKKHPSLTPDISGKKANDMSWAVRSALGYWETKSGGLNSQILSRYYALLQFSMAEQITSQNPEDDLGSIQSHTEYGHGLFTIKDEEYFSFPTSYYIGCLKSGHFYEYCKYLGIDLSSLTFNRRSRSFREIGSDHHSNLLSLETLLCRVPELHALVGEYFGRNPLSFHIGYDSIRNQEEKIKKGQGIPINPFFPKAEILSSDDNSELEKTFITIYPHGYNYSLEEIIGSEIPLNNIETGMDILKRDIQFTGTFTHPKGNWGTYLKTYKSGYSGTSWISPFWGTNDPFLLHLIILYGFSIIVRYLPDLWHRIEDGDLDHIRAFLEHYLVIVDNVLPKLVVERLTGTHLLVTQPGSLHSQI